MNKDVVKVTYHWQHVGHIPTSIDDVRRGPAHRAIKEFIQEQVDNNMTWYNIKNMLRLDKDILSNILNEDNIENVPIGLQIKYNDAEIAVINMAYNMPDTTRDDQQGIVFNNNVKIMICHWHLLKA
jgi:hypothetical protein